MIYSRLKPADNPVTRRYLGIVHERIGKMLEVEGRKPEALVSYQKSFAIREAFALDYPANTNARRDLAIAHEKLGVWIASHYGLPGLTYGMDGMTHVSATSRWGYSYTRSTSGQSYEDIRKLFAAANEPKLALWVEGANHNDVAFVGGARYSDTLKAFAILIQRYPPEAGSQRL